MPIKNSITISVLFLTFVSTNLLVNDPCKGMFGEEDEKEQSSRPVQQNSSFFGVLPDDTLFYIFSLLKVEDLGRISQVSSRWYGVFSVPRLWEKIGLENYKDYFSVADLAEKSKEKVIHHYLSVILNALDSSEETGICKNFRKKYDFSSFIPYFKTCLPKEVKSFYEGFSAKAYGKFEMPQDIEAKKEIEKLLCERDHFIQLAKSEATEQTIANPYYKGWDQAAYYGGSHKIPSYGRNPTITSSVPNGAHLESAKKINEKLIGLGNENAAKMKKEQLTTRYSEYAGLNNLYRGYHEDWDNFVKSSMDELCSKGYLFAFEWKIEWLLKQNENGKEFIESMLQNNNPIIRNMGHYVRVFALKQGKLGYEKDHDKVASYIRFYNIPY